MRQWRTENCGHMTESGMVSIHENWLFGPRPGLCSVWLSIKCIMGSQTPDLCKNIIFENQLLFNIDSYMNRVTIHCSSVRYLYCPQPGVSSNFLAFLQNLRPGLVSESLWIVSTLRLWRERWFIKVEEMLVFKYDIPAKICCLWPHYAFYWQSNTT